MELQHFSHNHPLILSEDRSHEADIDGEKIRCSTCGEIVMSGQRFSCVACGFHLHKKCAEAASQMNHPFHRNHSLNLLVSSPYDEANCVCDFCGEGCDNFVYHCSCNLDLHIKCALLSYSIIAEKNIGNLQLIPIENHSEDKLKEAKCFACWKPLLDSAAYLSLDYSGFFIHKSCVELPLEINHLSHRQHSLFLQFKSEGFLCQICQDTQHRGSFVYSCSICKSGLHIECVSPSPIIEDTSCHEHPFARCFRHVSFICDACGTSGDGVSYICTTCSLIVHKKCISLPRIIKSVWHHHPISHHYFVVDNECGVQECGVCHEEVKKEYGSYTCSDCKFIVHVNCALEDSGWYYKIESKDDYENQMLAADSMEPTFSVIKEIKHGDKVINSEIKHFSHPHNIVLSDEVKDDSRCCDGCTLLIIAPFYDCLQCDFCLHKSCAELPRKKLIWFHYHQLPCNLIPNRIFQCQGYCCEQCSGFAYECGEYLCNYKCCIRCTEISLARTSPGHKHILPFYLRYNLGMFCKACGNDCSPDKGAIYRCKDCNFNVHVPCTLFPQIARHKCDEHYLILMHHEDNNYSEYHYCDICEERRNSNNWFYYCSICDNSAHPNCVLKDHPFIKLGIKIFKEKDHSHFLASVKKVYHYPECFKCGKPCLDLALKCVETRCNYIIHWKCSSLGFIP